jgi:c-di-GMP-binding flagellar brake protein YcgR
MAEERRKFERIEAPVRVKYKLLSEGSPGVDTAGKNIGGGGIRLSLKEKLQPGTLLKLEIGLPSSTNPITAIGKVVWIKEVLIQNKNVTSYYDTGIEFVKVSLVALGRIYKHFHEQKRLLVL